MSVMTTRVTSAIMTGNYLTTRGCGYEDDDALLATLGTLRR